MTAFSRLFPSGAVCISAIEHPCVFRSAQSFCGHKLTVLPVLPSGVLDLEQAYATLKNLTPPALVAVMAVNNETGILQPCRQVFNFCREHGLLTVCDASQWPGRIPLNQLPQADYTFFGAHKCGGPKGVGVLLQGLDAPQLPILVGGGQELGLRSGTENLPAIAAMSAALQVVNACEPKSPEGVRLFLDRLNADVPGVIAYGDSKSRLWNTIYCAMPRFPASRWVPRLHNKGFCVGTGAGCSSRSQMPSKVLTAMGYDHELAFRSLRFSSHLLTTDQDWIALANAVSNVFQELQSESHSVSI